MRTRIRNLLQGTPKRVTLKNSKIVDNRIAVCVSEAATIRTGQEVFLVTPSKKRTRYNKIKNLKDVIVRAKVEAIDGNEVVLSSVPEYATVVEANGVINNCIKADAPIYVEAIEKW